MAFEPSAVVYGSSYEECLAISNAFTNSLDRSVLRGFASSVEAFHIADMLMRLAIASNDVDTGDRTDRYVELMGQRERLIDRGLFDIEMVSGELMYWWIKSKKPSEGGMSYSTSGNSTREWVDKLSMVEKFPEYYEYLIAGIWDVAAIVRYARDGIDPNIAYQLSR